MLLDEPAPCPMCGKQTSVVSEVWLRHHNPKLEDSLLTVLCAKCSTKDLGEFLVLCRLSIASTLDATKTSCAVCGGAGYISTKESPAAPCRTCLATGIDVGRLLDAVGVSRRERPRRAHLRTVKPEVLKEYADPVVEPEAKPKSKAEPKTKKKVVNIEEGKTKRRRYAKRGA